MYYSNRTQAIRGDNSHIEFDRIFCGQYWDELGCVPFLGGATGLSKVLMLGLGDGAAIRPILCSNQVDRLVCVDVDSESINGCRTIYAHNFPKLKFCIVQADAQRYLDQNQEKYDVIVVDLYTRDRYSPIVFAEEFHELLAQRLESGGHLVFNAYGVPMHLRPFEGNSAQAFLAQILWARWKVVRYLPYRRNATLIVGGPTFPRLEAHLNRAYPSGLKLSDRLAIDLMQIRLKSLPIVARSCVRFNPEMTFHEAIDREMRRRWASIVPQIDALAYPDFRIESPSDILKLLDNWPVCVRLLDRLAADEHELFPLIPILLAGEINNNDLSADWFLDWSLEFLSNAQSKARQTFVEFCLPQAFSILINWKNMYRSKIFAFRPAIERLAAETT